MSTQPRHPRGTARGGRFASATNTESTNTLGDYEPPAAPVDVAEPGSYYPDIRGANYEGHLPVAEVAKRIRHDLKEATKSGHLPVGIGRNKISYSVRSHTYAGGQAVDVTIKGLDDDDIFFGHTPRGDVAYSPEVSELRDRVERIAKSYNRSQTNSMVDYFREDYYANVAVETEYQARSAERDRLLRRTKKATKAARTVEEVQQIRERFRTELAEADQAVMDARAASEARVREARRAVYDRDR